MNDVKMIKLSNISVEYLEDGSCILGDERYPDGVYDFLTKEDVADLLGFLKRCSVKDVEGWFFDDLWEGGYRFNNKQLRVWTVVPRSKASNEKEALEYLLNNHDLLEINSYT